jgi:hypothetical protein
LLLFDFGFDTAFGAVSNSSSSKMSLVTGFGCFLTTGGSFSGCLAGCSIIKGFSFMISGTGIFLTGSSGEGIVSEGVVSGKSTVLRWVGGLFLPEAALIRSFQIRINCFFFQNKTYHRLILENYYFLCTLEAILDKSLVNFNFLE